MKEKVFLDIETTSLDADTGIIVAIGLGFENKGTEILFVNAHEEEENILVNTFSKISEKQVVTFNGTRFDIPFLLTRGLKYDLIIPKIDNIDLYYWAVKHLRLQSRKFHDICIFYGIFHEEISGREVNELYIKALSGDENAKKRIYNHLNQDISAMRSFYQKIKPLLMNYPPPKSDPYRR